MTVQFVARRGKGSHRTLFEACAQFRRSIFLDARFRGHDVIPAQAGIQSSIKWAALENPDFLGTELRAVFTLFYGSGFTIVRNPKDELKTGTFHTMLTQLGLSSEDL